MANTRPEHIVDKNGKSTTVHKSTDQKAAQGRSATAPAPKSPKVSYEEVRDTVIDLFDKQNEINSRNNFRPTVLSIDTIMVGLIGHDPTRGKNLDPRFSGGRTKAAWYGDYLPVSAATKVLDQLVEDGVLVKVKSPSYTEERDGNADKNSPFVSFPYRTKSGYIPKENLEDSKAQISDKENAIKIEKLRAQAALTVAALHQDEVDAELQRLREKAGI